MTVTFVVPGEPRSKARPRYSTRNGKVVVYTPKSTVTAEQEIGYAFKAAAGSGYKRPDDDAFRVECTFMHGNLQRRDVDNMLKAVLDGLNGLAWLDDAQVTEITGRKVLVSPDDARSEIVITNIGPRDRPRKTCPVCFTAFPVYTSWGNSKVYCSRACGTRARQLARTRTCNHCREDFLVHGASHPDKHCSLACRKAAQQARNAPTPVVITIEELPHE